METLGVSISHATVGRQLASSFAFSFLLAYVVGCTKLDGIAFTLSLNAFLFLFPGFRNGFSRRKKAFECTLQKVGRVLVYLYILRGLFYHHV